MSYWNLEKNWKLYRVNDFFQELFVGIKATSIGEWVAFLSGVAYVVLAALKSIYCWIFALISSALYVYICYSTDLFIESSLQIFYVVMAIIGWFIWNHSKSDKLFVKTWPLKYHLINILVSLVIAFVLGYLFERYTTQANPYVDAFTTVYSLAATYMITQKILNNWLYWIVIDLALVYLYGSQGLELTSVLYLVYSVLAIFAWMQWRKQFKLQAS